ncbi:hypothetical protein K438DRAFT_1973714 [Mycena galopus ATCC 62051]|nr:hypothetical protein K438DRAFT_1973714 [Mycena galopus ATCC 62051]
MRAGRTPEEVEKAGQQRKEGDADYREFRRHRKFIEKYGQSNFLEVYFPLTDTDAAAASDNGIHIFNTRTQASRAWARHCRRRHSAGCHETEEPAVHPSDADSDIGSDTEEPRARARVLDRAARQRAKTRVKNPKTTVQVVKREVSVKSERSLLRAMSVPVKRAPVSTSRAASVPVKRAAAPKAEPASPKKLSLYADMEDSDEDVFQSDSSMEVPLASLAPSRRDSRATSVLSSLAASRPDVRGISALSDLEEDKDVAVPPPHPVTPISPMISSASSLSTTSAAPSNFWSISGALCASAPPAVGPSGRMFFNRCMRVLYDDPKAAIEEKKPGESLQVVDAGKILPLIRGLGSSANLLYNHETQILYDDLQVAVEERNTGDSMQVVEPAEVVPLISTVGR